eukprot:s9173_g1.t1
MNAHGVAKFGFNFYYAFGHEIYGSDIEDHALAFYKAKGLNPPDRVKEATSFFLPFVDELMQCIKHWTQVKNYATKNPEQDVQAAQRMQQLEEEAAKYKQRLRRAGLEITPQKMLPVQDP